MSTALTIRNLDEKVKQKLRLRAAKNETSMEAEARKILSEAVNTPEENPPSQAEILKRIQSVAGVWKDRGTTDELMEITRGEG
ncbi:MAG: plasmid stabilization protein [Verrucomicrobiota bacterium]